MFGINAPTMNHYGINDEWEKENARLNLHGERVLELLRKTEEKGITTKMGLDVSLYDVNGELIDNISKNTEASIRDVRASMVKILLTSGKKAGNQFIIESDPEMRMLRDLSGIGFMIFS